MDWFTDCAMRQITQNVFDKYWNKSDQNHLKSSESSSDILCLRTEFMTADGYIRNPWWVIRHLLTTKDQKNLIAQIFWWNQETLVKTAIDIQNKYWKYFKWIELNIWCPANNVMKSWWWSALLNDKKNTLKIIKDIKSNLDMSFSIKTRTGLNDKDKSNQTEFILQASKYCNMITIHWRTLVWWYHELPDREFIYNIKKLANKNCKIIWNGWITYLTWQREKSQNQIGLWQRDLKKETILDGLMIWQSAIWNPRILTAHIPNRKELKETILHHLNLSINNELQFQKNIQKSKLDIKIPVSQFLIPNSSFPISNKPILEFRKHLFNYIKWIPWSKEFKQKVAQIKDYENLTNEINNFL